MTEPLQQLRELGEELRGLLAEERAAIVALDHARLSYCAEQKVRVAHALDTVRNELGSAHAPELRDLFAALRVELGANAMLAAAATQAVRALLGVESTAGYDRRAQPGTLRMRALATF